MLIVIPRSTSSGARSILSKATYFVPAPCPASTLVIAAVSVVLPWSAWPIVPMLTCGLLRTYVCLLIVPWFLDAGGAEPAKPTTLLLGFRGGRCGREEGQLSSAASTDADNALSRDRPASVAKSDIGNTAKDCSPATALRQTVLPPAEFRHAALLARGPARSAPAAVDGVEAAGVELVPAAVHNGQSTQPCRRPGRGQVPRRAVLRVHGRAA